MSHNNNVITDITFEIIGYQFIMKRNNDYYYIIINNKTENKQIKKEELQHWIDLGWTRGRITDWPAWNKGLKFNKPDKIKKYTDARN